MSVSLRDLMTDGRLGLRLHAGTMEGTPGISWAHGTDLSDPTPFLQPGNMVLTTGRQFADGDAGGDVEGYVDRLRRAQVSAIGFGTGVIVDGIPEALIDACRATGTTLVEIPLGTPFIAVVRRIGEILESGRRRRLHEILDAQRAVSTASLTRDGWHGGVRRAAKLLDATVWLLDERGEVTRTYGRATVPRPETRRTAAEMMRGNVRGRRDESDESSHIVLHTLGPSGDLLGVIALGCSRPVDPLELSVFVTAVALAEVSMMRAGSVETGVELLCDQVLALVRDGHGEVAENVVRGLGLTWPGAQVVAVRMGPSGVDVSRGLRRWLRHASPGGVVGTDDVGDLALVDAGVLSDLLEWMERHEVRGGVSSVSSWEAIGDAIDEADRCCRSAREGEIVAVETLASRSLLGALVDPHWRPVAVARLRPLLERPDGDDLLRACGVWLGHNGQWEPAARDLGLHRHTLKQRVAQVGRALDLDLMCFEARAELWALLRAAPPGSHAHRRAGTTPARR